MRYYLLLALFFYTVPASGQTTYHVYYMGGQSNMEGFGFVRDLPAALAGVVEDIRIFQGSFGLDEGPLKGEGIWTALRPGHGTGFTSDGKTNAYTDRFGPELSFAHTMKALHADRHIAIIKYARNGSSIDTLAAGTWGAWDPDYVGTNGINQYDHFLSTIRNALRVRDIDGDGEADTLIPSGIVWMQGESDAGYGHEIALRYEANLKRLMDLMRAAFHTDDLPVVIGRISESGRDENDGIVWTYGHIVRSAQSAYARSDHHAALVTATDTYAYSDPWHYDSEGYIDLGEKFARAMMHLEQ